MIIRPELQALRGNDAPQRQAQAAMRAAWEGWRGHGPGSQLDAELARFGAGAELEDLPLLAALFDPVDGCAAELIGAMLATILTRLNSEPLSQSPLRFSTDQAHSSLVLARQGNATLVLQAFSGAGLAQRGQPASLGFSPTETVERVLAGSAKAERIKVTAHRPGGVELEFTHVDLDGGSVTRRLGESEAQLLRQIPGVLVMLKLQRRTGTGTTTCEYRLADGALIHQAAASQHDSRLELAAALLGKMGRSDAAPLLAAMAEEVGGPSLRWQSLRECLGLDSATGFATLCRIAQRADDPLAVPAGELRAQLIESYPQLAGACPCPA